jgi:uncharacterized protein (DUF58 family)
MRLAGPGWGALLGGGALLGAGLLLGYRALTGIGTAAWVALGVAATAVVLRPRVAVERRLEPDRVSVGEPALVRLAVKNVGALPTPGFDATQPLDEDAVRVRIAPLASGQRRVVHAVVPTQRRGLVRLGPVLAERRDPFGLLRRAEPLCDGAWLWVRPQVYSLPALPIGKVLDFEGRLTDAAPRGSSTFAALREYLPGDDPRFIHWRSSARVGTLLVREQVDTTEPTTTIVVDTRRSALDEAQFEEAVSLAASVVTASRRAGQRAELAAVGEDVERVHAAGGHDVLDRLAALRQGDQEGTAPLLRCVERTRAGGCLVVVSGDAGLVSGLAPARRRFQRVVVVLLPVSADRYSATTAVSRRPGLAILRADSARDAVLVWRRMAGGGAG